MRSFGKNKMRLRKGVVVPETALTEQSQILIRSVFL